MRDKILSPGILVVATGLLLAGLAVAHEPHLYVATSNGLSGSSDVLDISAPWTATLDVEAIGPNVTVRYFYGRHYVVDQFAGTIQVIDAGTLDTILTFSVGSSSAPHDILVVAPTRAYVTRYGDMLLYEVDPQTGSVNDTIDLSGFADADGIPDMSMMALDGNRLFVQLQRIDYFETGLPVTPSFLAVIDIRTNALIDVDPVSPGTQGIVLTGTVPSFKMQVETVRRRLYVSCPATRLDVSGGVEEVDLDSLSTLGFVVTEERFEADLGGFVMTSPDDGFVVGHTDIIQSNHVTYFHRDPDVPDQGEIYSTLGFHQDWIEWDAATRQVFYPDPASTPPGIQVFDADTATQISPGPIATSLLPTDLVVARDTTPGEASGLRVVDRTGPAGGMNLTYVQACGATNHNVVFGPLADVADHGYSGQVCGVGASGTVTGFDPGPGSFFFLVVGTDGADREGSYGVRSNRIERPEVALDRVCSFTQDLARRCD